MKAALTPDCLTLTLSIHELASRGPTEVDPVCCDQSTPQSSYNATATRHRRAHKTFQRQLSQGTWFVLSTVLNICALLGQTYYYYHMQWTAGGSVFGEQPVNTVCGFFICVWNISGTAEWICAKFTQNVFGPLLRRVWRLRSKVKGQGHQKQKTAFCGRFGGLCVVYVW